MSRKAGRTPRPRRPGGAATAGAGIPAKLLVTGCARSGTTLLHTLLSNWPTIKNFRFKETWPARLEQESPRPSRRRYVLIKRPQAHPADPRRFQLSELLANDYRILNLIRDPYDVLVSRHPRDPGRYWVEPERWLAAAQETLTVAEHPALHIVSYEDLCRQPDEALERVAAFLDLTDWEARESSPHPPGGQLSDPATDYLAGTTLYGVRPPLPDRIGAQHADENRARVAMLRDQFGEELEQSWRQLNDRFRSQIGVGQAGSQKVLVAEARGPHPSTARNVP